MAVSFCNVFFFLIEFYSSFEVSRGAEGKEGIRV